jgi:flagellar hook assembly protein FlgD
LPISFRLEPGFPNPFNAGVALRFSVDTLGPARLEVYGVNGQRVRTLLSRDLSPGRYRDIWDGRDEAGHSVASGVYLLRLASVGREAYQRVLLLK